HPRYLHSFPTRRSSDLARQVVTIQRDKTRNAEATVNRIKAELSAATARVDVLEESLQPAPGSALAAIENFGPQDVSEILDIESGWAAVIATLLAGSTDRARVASREQW